MALENGRWQGKVEQHLGEIDRRLQGHNDWIESVDNKTDEYQRQTAAEVASLKAKVGMGAFFGSIIGSIVVGVIVAVVVKGT